MRRPDRSSGPADSSDVGRLAFRATAPTPATGSPGGTGRRELRGTSEAAPAWLYVPPAAEDRPVRAMVLLHGAGGEPRSMVQRLLPYADRYGLLLVAPQSVGRTWDVIEGGFGPDVRNVDRLLERVSVAYPVQGLTVAGFSDGASYALSLGVGNGDVFDSVIAFSPGFLAAEVTNGRARFYVSHGRADRVLPIDVCSRRLVPQLEDHGYDVRYREFTGGHEVPEAVAQEAVRWLAGPAGT